VERGIVTDRYTLEGHGNRHLAAEGGERNPLNRRVEIKVTMRAN
jgi:outer membrane protein OmpA-like peptidoglycan-associated protein